MLFLRKTRTKHIHFLFDQANFQGNVLLHVCVYGVCVYSVGVGAERWGNKTNNMRQF